MIARAPLVLTVAAACAACIPNPAPRPTAPDDGPRAPDAPAASADGDGELLHVDFENAPLGPYTQESLAADFRGVEGHGQGLERASIVATEQGRSLRVRYPRGSVGPGEGGAQFVVKLPPGHDELRCSYRVRFAAGFDFVRGGKLPGLVGGSRPTGGKPRDDGFSARLMWRVSGAAVQYVYYPGQTSTYGVDLPYLLAGGPARFHPGAWHRVEHRLVMNTPGQANGVLQAWIDGQLALDQRDRVWRLDGSIHIDALYFSTFFGGNNPSWGATRDETVDFDNFVVSHRRL